MTKTQYLIILVGCAILAQLLTGLLYVMTLLVGATSLIGFYLAKDN